MAKMNRFFVSYHVQSQTRGGFGDGSAEVEGDKIEDSEDIDSIRDEIEQQVKERYPDASIVILNIIPFPIISQSDE